MIKIRDHAWWRRDHGKICIIGGIQLLRHDCPTPVIESNDGGCEERSGEIREEYCKMHYTDGLVGMGFLLDTVGAGLRRLSCNGKKENARQTLEVYDGYIVVDLSFKPAALKRLSCGVFQSSCSSTALKLHTPSLLQSDGSHVVQLK